VDSYVAEPEMEVKFSEGDAAMDMPRRGGIERMSVEASEVESGDGFIR
jgi:hypothetical protein